MIIDKFVKTCYAGSNVEHLKNLGYKLNGGDLIEIPIEHIGINSHVEVNCKCDICGCEKKMTYQTYRNKIKFDGKYYCYKCSNIKRTKVINEKYGVDNVFQLQETKDKMKISFMRRFGVEHPNKCKIVMDKMKQTNIERYGCENVFQNEEIKGKIISANIEKYGAAYSTQRIDTFSKILLSGKKIKMYNENLYYQGSYEKDFLDYCNDLKILNLITKPKKTIQFQYNDKKYYYHPDFFMKKLNLIIEIKSDYWWNKLLEINLAKEMSVKEHGYNYIVIMNKDYSSFKNIIS